MITQNIDNLHQASGIAAEDVVELHGNTTYATCLDCAKRYELSWVKQSFDPAGGTLARMHVCGGYIKTATVSFGQAMPEAAMRRAQELTVGAICSSRSARRWWCGRRPDFRWQAKRNGARLVIINRECDRIRRNRRSRGARRHRRRRLRRFIAH